ncbi:MAG TPA: A24 family peptidase [Candidatus Wallbacteria bacterium]|nr:A24 family peptidase [Candidatus Wallbacteria bacterium]
MQNLIDIILFSILFISLYTDLKSGKIYNWVTLPAMAGGLLLNFMISGQATAYAGLLNSVYGILVALIIFVLPYLIGALGGGDVKLLMAIGALKGYVFLFYSVLAIGVVSFFLSLFVFLLDMMKSYKLSGILNMAVIYFNNNVMVSNEEIKPMLKKNLKFGVSITFGTIIAYLYLWYR